MKKVVYITSGKIGIHRFTFNELELLQKNNCEIVLCLTQLNKGPWMPKPEWSIVVASKITAFVQLISLILFNKNGLTLLIYAYNKGVIPYFLMALSFYKELKGENLKSLHCQMGDNKLYIGYFLKKLLELPLSVTVHAHELYQRKVYDDNESIKELFESCDKVITISNFNKRILIKEFHIDESKIHVMRLFPDIDNLKLVKDKFKILIVANWIEKKGYSTLLKALKNIDRDDFVLWVVGGPIQSDDSIDVEALVKEYGLQDKVAILGSQSSPLIDIIFESCDMFCLPSITDYYKDGKPAEREGIPVALMEAMAWSKPVVATNHAGNSELIEGQLVEERNVRELVDAIKYLMDNPSERTKQGERNEKIINTKYSKSNIKELLEVFDNF